ncbi:MAG: UvrD-helicase domain-containing protein [Muribaculaceae bacterium]|nr:UvrD-helicase domain-containing protein [Muribaculaceae bacterium]
MLKIQRASAGSGKTYALAKNYIINLIAFKNNEGKWQIRNQRQIEDAIQHILAITFTNKATNEMKQRIVNNLSLLGKATNINDSDKDSIDKIPYLKEFIDLLGVSCHRIGVAATIALQTILNNFSHFKISTIDSFFQEILRTFTYETNINDAYQLELDSVFVADEALDAAIHELDTNPNKMGNASFWLKTLMAEEAQKSQRWNPFNKNSASISIYSRIRNALFQLESENFKEVKDKIDLFFDDQSKSLQLIDFYHLLKKKALDERRALLQRIKNAHSQVNSFILTNDLSNTELSASFLSHLAKIENLSINDEISFVYNKIILDQSVFKKKFRVTGHPLDYMALELYDLIEEWKNPSPDSFYKNWLIYGELVPYLGLILEVRDFMTKVLDNNNRIQLSDTGYILKKIIGEDDAPFIFERLGNRIESYLIDEFQDTSKLQWEVIKPLLSEGLAKNNDSLIIGDPKQSIYRFRNADHTLITSTVPNEFPAHELAGISVEDNTNWRSAANIVKFNNYFFKVLANAIAGLSKEKGNKYDFLDLYSNVVQFPHYSENNGYVEVRFFQKPDKESSNSLSDTDDLGKDWFEKEALKNIGPLIQSILERGYTQEDIAILVNTNEKGKNVVQALIEFNNSLKSSEKKINFISEESLLVSSSPAVEIIIGILKKITDPQNFLESKEQDTEKPQAKIYLNWNNIKTDYILYSAKNSDLSPAECMLAFISEKKFQHSLASMLKNLATPSLTSIVESIVKDFLDDSLKRSEALYIASFQDFIVENAASFHNDTLAFLEWWNSRGANLSVATPEGSDAVRIMTIHKSKGLEFQCVIVPFATDSFQPSSGKEEWRWEIPQVLPGINMPPVLPVKTSSKLLGSIHENIYKEFYDQVLTDKLNMYYVAFTRAVDELYVFTKNKSKNSIAINDFLFNILKGNIRLEETEDLSDPYLMQINELDFSEDETVVKFGFPFTWEQIMAKKIKNSNLNKTDHRFLDSYFVNNFQPKVRGKAFFPGLAGDIIND